MLRFFKSPQPATLFVIPVIVMLLWGRTFLHLGVSDEAMNMPLWIPVHNFLVTLPSFVNFLIIVTLISIQAIYFNHIVNRHEVLYVNSYLPAFFYALILCCTPQVLVFHPIHLVNLLLLRVLDKMFSLFKNDAPVSGLFDSSFLIAVSALFYFPSIIFYLLLIAGVNLMRPFSWREMMVLLIGFILPFFFILVYFFWTKNMGGFTKMFAQPFQPAVLDFNIVSSIALMSFALMGAFLLLASLVKLRRNFYKNVIRTRTFQRIMLLFLVIAGATLVFTRGIRVVHLEMLVIPVSVFFAYYFVSARRRLRLYEMMIWVFIGLILWNQIAA